MSVTGTTELMKIDEDDRMRESAEAIKYNTVYPMKNMDSKRVRDGESEMRERWR